MTGNRRYQHSIARARALFVFVVVLLSSFVVAPDTDVPSVDWDTLAEVQALSDAELIAAVNADAALLSNPQVLASISIRMTGGDVSLVNQHPAVLQAWGSSLGIEFVVGASIERFDGTRIATRGPNAVTFNPDEVPGATVQQDGSLTLPDQHILSGIVEKTEGGLMVTGTISDKNRNKIMNDASAMILSDDGFISTYGTTKVTTASGDYKTISGERSEYTLNFNDQNQLVVTAFTLTDVRNPVKISSEKQENTILLLSGRATMINRDKIKLEEIRFGGNVVPAFVEVQASPEQASTFSATKPTLLCFQECGNLNEIDPQDYSISAIELLRPLDYKGKHYGRNILKLTLRDDNQLITHLTNPTYASIFVDARGDTKATIIQDGTVLQGLHAKPYHLEVDVTHGEYVFRGKSGAVLGGSPLFMLDEPAAFDDNHHLISGGIRVFDPNADVGGMGYLVADTAFDLQSYHLGNPVPYTRVGRFMPAPTPVPSSAGLVILMADDANVMDRGDLLAHLQENIPLGKTYQDFLALSHQIFQYKNNPEWTEEDTRMWNRVLFEKFKDINANQLEKMDDNNWEVLQLLAKEADISWTTDPDFDAEDLRRAQEKSSEGNIDPLIDHWQRMGNYEEAARLVSKALDQPSENEFSDTHHLFSLINDEDMALVIFNKLVRQGRIYSAASAAQYSLKDNPSFNKYMAREGNNLLAQKAKEAYAEGGFSGFDQAYSMLLTRTSQADNALAELCTQALNDGHISQSIYTVRCTLPK